MWFQKCTYKLALKLKISTKYALKKFSCTFTIRKKSHQAHTHGHAYILYVYTFLLPVFLSLSGVGILPQLVYGFLSPSGVGSAFFYYLSTLARERLRTRRSKTLNKRKKFS